MKLYAAFIAFFFLTTITGCKQDFDVTADYKEVPVVYGLINQQDNAHYIRIQKGYLIDGNALLAAGVPDSIYYPDNLTVKITPFYNGSQSGSAFTLQRVDGNTLVPPIPKDSGAFSNSPNILYRFTGSLDANKKYKLEITNPTSGKVITAETDLVKDFSITVPTKAAKLNLNNNTPAKIVFSTAENAGIYDLTVRFYYKEYNQADNTLRADTFADIKLFQSLIQKYSAGTNIVTDLSGSLIFNGLANQLEATTNVYREFNVSKGMLFTFSAGGTTLSSYLNSQQAQGGLVSNEALPVYTNISDGVGIFSSRYTKQIDSVLLSNNGLDSLACNATSSSLRFKNHLGVLCQ